MEDDPGDWNSERNLGAAHRRIAFLRPEEPGFAG